MLKHEWPEDNEDLARDYVLPAPLPTPEQVEALLVYKKQQELQQKYLDGIATSS
jgi:hypothetical protein